MDLQEFQTKITELQTKFQVELDIDIKLFSVSVNYGEEFKLICPNLETTIEKLPGLLQTAKLKKDNAENTEYILSLQHQFKLPEVNTPEDLFLYIKYLIVKEGLTEIEKRGFTNLSREVSIEHSSHDFSKFNRLCDVLEANNMIEYIDGFNYYIKDIKHFLASSYEEAYFEINKNDYLIKSKIKLPNGLYVYESSLIKQSIYYSDEKFISLYNEGKLEIETYGNEYRKFNIID